MATTFRKDHRLARAGAVLAPSMGTDNFASWVRRSVVDVTYAVTGTSPYAERLVEPPGDPIGAFVEITRPAGKPAPGLSWALEATFTAALAVEVAALPAPDLAAGLRLELSEDNILFEALSTTLSGTYRYNAPAESFSNGDWIQPVALSATRPFSDADAASTDPLYVRVAWGANRPVNIIGRDEGETGGWDLAIRWIQIHPTL